jgi:hypothetical protein
MFLAGFSETFSSWAETVLLLNARKVRITKDRFRIVFV